CNAAWMCARSLSDRQSSLSGSEFRPGFPQQNRRWPFPRSGFRRVIRRSISRELRACVRLVPRAGLTVRDTRRRATQLPSRRCRQQPAVSFWKSCENQLLSIVLTEVGAVVQPQLPIAAAARDLLPGKPQRLLPKSLERMPARYRILSAAPSSKERLARKSADRHFRNKMAA